MIERDYLRDVEVAIEQDIKAFKPQIILYNAGTGMSEIGLRNLCNNYNTIVGLPNMGLKDDQQYKHC